MIKRQYKFQDISLALNAFKQLWIMFDTKIWTSDFEMTVIGPFCFKIIYKEAELVVSLDDYDYTIINTVDEIFDKDATYVTDYLRSITLNINNLMKDYGAIKKSIKEYDKEISSESDKGTRESSE